MFNSKKILLFALILSLQTSTSKCFFKKTSDENVTFGAAGFSATFVSTMARLFDYSKLVHTNRANFITKSCIGFSNIALISLLAGTGYKDLRKKPSGYYNTSALLTGAAAGFMSASLPFAAGQAGLIAGSHAGKIFGSSSIGAKIGQASLFAPASIVSMAAMVAACDRTAKNLLSALREKLD